MAEVGMYRMGGNIWQSRKKKEMQGEFDMVKRLLETVERGGVS